MEEEGINMRERQEALEKFRESLSLPLTERYYEEDELIDYFDFASDFNDDYLRMEALLCAARFYPNSEELIQRKAIFYSQYSEEVMDKCVEDNSQSTGIIWDVMRAKNAGLASSKAQTDALDAILANNDQFTDEEIIQFVGLVTSYGQEQWLKDNLDTLEKKAIFPAVLLYEAASAAEMRGDTEYSISLLEKLTEIEPFNPDFWIVLSKLYAQTQQVEKGLSALEYAIAIDPENADTLILKGRLLYAIGQKDDEIIALSKKIEELDGMSAEMLMLTGTVYKMRGETNRALDVYERFMHRHPDKSKDALLDMLTIVPEESEKLLERLYAIDSNLTEWLMWAEQCESMGAKNLSARMIETFCRHTQVSRPPFDMIDLTFRLGLFELTDILIDGYLSNEATQIPRIPTYFYEDEEDNRLAFYTIALITKLKLGKMGDVEILTQQILRHDSTGNQKPDVKEKLSILGFTRVLQSITGILNTYGDKYSWDRYDPFGFWESENSDS